MKTIFLKLGSLYAQASGGDDHTHGSGGEVEHLYPVLAVFAVLIIVGFAAGYYFNKKDKKP